MNVLTAQDRRAPHREDRAEALRNFYHPDEIADDPLAALARQAAFRYWNRMEMTGQDWAALKAEATLWAPRSIPFPLEF